MFWKESAVRNLLPLSKNKVFDEALKEWNYTGNIEDCSAATEICGLCNHPNIRYKFEIYNKYTGKYLYVGSECICKFGIVGLDENGNEISQDETVKMVNSDKRQFIKDNKVKQVLNSLVMLSSKDSDFEGMAENFYKYYQEKGAFTPKQLNILLYKLKKNDIPFNKLCFKMKLRKDREKQQLLEMPQYQVKNIWDCLSSSQKEFYKRNIQSRLTNTYKNTR